MTAFVIIITDRQILPSNRQYNLGVIISRIMKYCRFTDNTIKTVSFINISGYRIRPSHYRQHNLDCFRYHYDRLSNTASATENTTMAAFAINMTDSNTDLGLRKNQRYCRAIYNTAEASVR